MSLRGRGNNINKSSKGGFEIKKTQTKEPHFQNDISSCKKNVKILATHNKIKDNKFLDPNNIDTTLINADINSVSYVYNDLNENKKTAKFNKFLKNTNFTNPNNVNYDEKNNFVSDLLSLEKNKTNNSHRNITYSKNIHQYSCLVQNKNFKVTKEKDVPIDNDKEIHSIIYNTFINKNLKIKNSNINSVTNNTDKYEQKCKKYNDVSLNSGKIRPNISTSSKFVNIKKSVNKKNTYNNYKNILISPITKKEYSDKTSNITETDEELTNLFNDKSFLYEKIKVEKKNNKHDVFTQTNMQYEEENLKIFSKCISKKIIYQAIVQITYEQNIQQIELEKMSINLNDQNNKQKYYQLVKCQNNNLNFMDRIETISGYISIFNKMKIFANSSTLINSIMQNNIEYAKKIEQFKISKQLIWENNIIHILLKKILFLLLINNIVPFLANELIEDSFLNIYLFSQKENHKIDKKLCDEKNYQHEKRKIENGHFTFCMSNEKINVKIPLKISENMNMDDVLKKIKNYINRKLSYLQKEYDLNLLFIEKNGMSILNIKDLFSHQSGEFNICLTERQPT
ncbi:conserved Plasmodium protein, unknown function [Plasmodium berghei]|uniref:Uncharacterized protein n=2 Tax=Plasmodium berghei TaxID=5821 RepID=A0A509AHI8_PLABA|nr:conserved Plasmodium protein, unknown function [Plasmodium berghei ANKA]CXH92518.1 conserved Plasmodium protein, unknown function [Plasmodium berghei]SCL90678.1 conserved Plasmodium protein, unknown function [Plasmodium berghei]SCM15330.1 conserved Plasmodium protein, unknown function [Plasmodium berghei]SCM17123.1 conserved Plasmodium protein, unknown function [Plasmodium berghei]SCN22114.1 conserved Plasmodium protein, unknown function [Plasmodium berghei]|eukprot:XP_034419914.1 conserved Plasmodium protein, unknown function [Plasmodium berghei ANKA]